jgi:hypothetical protein
VSADTTSTNEAQPLADQELTCCECGEPFVWSLGEQRFFAEHRLLHPPKRCPSCRDAKRRARQTQGDGTR